MQHACLPAKTNNVDSVLDFEGEGFKWVFCFQQLFGKQSRRQNYESITLNSVMDQ
jgi:hypothetical protein